MDSTTRRLRMFVALAEHRHFGRAASQLFVSQQALSKQITVLETEVGVTLVRRTTRWVELTPAGELFLRSCQEALRVLDEGAESVRGEPGFLRVGVIVLGALELTDPILDAFRARRPGCEIVLRQFTFSDPSAGLASRSSDLAIVRLPLAVPGLSAERLFVEPRVLAVPADHRFASREVVTVEEILDERMTVSTATDEEYRRFWTLADYRTAPMGPPIAARSHAEELEVVASGRALSITSACAARLTPHDGVRFIRITGVPGTECALAWRAEEETELIREFRDETRRVLRERRSLVAQIENPEGAVSVQD